MLYHAKGMYLSLMSQYCLETYVRINLVLAEQLSSTYPTLFWKIIQVVYVQTPNYGSGIKILPRNVDRYKCCQLS